MKGKVSPSKKNTNGKINEQKKQIRILTPTNRSAALQRNDCEGNMVIGNPGKDNHEIIDVTEDLLEATGNKFEYKKSNNQKKIST